jgi:enamine deaminase RidA (YjgF/YER057c/UK114 family)
LPVVAAVGLVEVTVGYRPGMPTPTQRLAELGITLPSVVPPVAAYVPAVRTGSLVYTSGQLPMVAGAMPATGKVGAAVTPEQAYDCARACALNALAAVDALVGLDTVARVVKVVGFVASAPDFTGQPQVVNGASELLGEVFGDPHARSAVGVAALPLDAPVEVELIVEVTTER